ncbi:hypothetical protein V5O48_013477 [Marasmius crinis-equi]|uniref:Uncharacterized protein n=1 Tax=Marasmius crinis-equi TaxID=585013 RepID=A0ABR3EZY6_9AGAR
MKLRPVKNMAEDSDQLPLSKNQRETFELLHMSLGLQVMGMKVIASSLGSPCAGNPLEQPIVDSMQAMLPKIKQSAILPAKEGKALWLSKPLDSSPIYHILTEILHIIFEEASSYITDNIFGVEHE